MEPVLVYPNPNNWEISEFVEFYDLEGALYKLNSSKFLINGQLKKELKKNFENHSKTSIYEATLNKSNEIINLEFITRRISFPVEEFIFESNKDSKAQFNSGLITNKAAFYSKDKFSFLNKEGTGFINDYDTNKIFSKQITNQKAELTKNLSLFQAYNKIEVKLKLKGRLAIGLGNESIYETGISFHPIYGIPYIPASSIKGVVRNYFLDRYFQLTDKEITENNERADKDKITPEKKAFQDAGFCFLFGADKDSITGARQGAIVFMDSFPDENLNIEPDIVNPHYKDYYDDIEGKTPPGDWMNPVPIIFLTATGAIFEVTILGKKYKDMPLHNIRYKTIDEQGRPLEKTIGENTWIENGQPIQIMLDHLKIALKENGIGAKTAVDYGKFKEMI